LKVRGRKIGREVEGDGVGIGSRRANWAGRTASS